MPKTCSKCSVEKHESDFAADKTKGDGLRSYCRVCTKQYLAEYRQANRERLSAIDSANYHRRKNADPEGYRTYALARTRDYRRRHPDAWKKNYHKRKRELFEAYGGCKCARCGIDDMRCLSIDHIENNGNEHRLEVMGDKRAAGANFYRMLKKNNYPPGYQVLCMNCQWIKRNNNGVLPPLGS